MPFHTHLKTNQQFRKETDSFITHRNTHPRYSIHSPSIERVSGFASRGSITLEAAISVSLFFFALLLLMSFLEMMYLQVAMKSALCSVGKQAAEELVFPFQMEERLVEILGKEMLEQSMIVGGEDGLDCSESKQYWGTMIMELVVEYEVRLPLPIFQISALSQREAIRVKGWNGKEGLGLLGGEQEIVYVTEYGMVYHKEPSCTYLELSIRPLPRSETKGYSPCSYCKKKEAGQQMVYVTDYGNCYHETLDCRGLRRKVYAVSLKDVYGIGGCSKCVK